MKACRECSASISKLNKTGICRTCYQRNVKRRLYKLRKEAGYNTGEKVTLRQLQGLPPRSKVPKKFELVSKPIPKAGWVECTKCWHRFWADEPLLDVVCEECGSLEIIRVRT